MLVQDSLFTQLFDLDNDGALSYFEFQLLTTFLSIPPSDCAIAFDMFDVSAILGRLQSS